MVEDLRKKVLHGILEAAEWICTKLFKSIFGCQPIVQLDDDLRDRIGLELECRCSDQGIGDLTLKSQQRHDALVAGVEGTIVEHNLVWTCGQRAESLQLSMVNGRNDGCQRLSGLDLRQLRELSFGDQNYSSFSLGKLVSVNLRYHRFVFQAKRMVLVHSEVLPL